MMQCKIRVLQEQIPLLQVKGEQSQQHQIAILSLPAVYYTQINNFHCRNKMNLNMEPIKPSHLYIFFPQKSVHNCGKRKAYQNKLLTIL